jgi:uncharacterized protein YjbI with pentapeptide repeats
LTGANLNNANLSNTSLEGVVLDGANLTGANLFGANSEEGGITGTPLALDAGVLISNGYLVGPGVSLGGARLSNADLTGAGADLAAPFLLPMHRQILVESIRISHRLLRAAEV